MHELNMTFGYVKVLVHVHVFFVVRRRKKGKMCRVGKRSGGGRLRRSQQDRKGGDSE